MWTAQQIPSPFDSPSPWLTSVSCAVAGECEAVGRNASDASDVWQPIAEKLSAGVWTGVELPLPADAWNESLSSVSCVAPGACVAAGTYTDHARTAERPLTESLSGGIWTPAVVGNPSDVQDESLTAVSCVPDASCWAVGTATKTDGGTHPFAVEQPAPAVVDAPNYSVTVEGAGTGTGVVTGGAISCPGTCEQNYPAGSQVTLSATPSAGSEFAGWSGGECAGTDTCTFLVTANTTVTATFIAETQLTVSAPATTTYGSSVTFSGTLTQASNGDPVAANVTLWQRKGLHASWEQIRSAPTSADGTVTAKYVPTETASYEWRYPGTDDFLSATSPIQRVTVTQAVRVHVTDATVRTDTRFTLYGTVNPAGSGKWVHLQRLVNGDWTNIRASRLAKLTLPNAGRTVGYEFVQAMPHKGRYRYRVFRPHTDALEGGYSRTVTVTVRARG